MSPLHSRASGSADVDDVYASSDLSVCAPTGRFPDGEIDPRHAYTIVHDELMLEGNPRLNLATFCTTWFEPEVRALMDEAIDRNIVDKDEYPQTAAIEARCVRMLADLWNAPESADPMGTSTTGSSEAAMLAGLAAKHRWRAERLAAGKPADRPNLVSGPVQVCWEKFARYFDVELREAPMTASSYVLTPAQVVERCDENTIAVVVTLGQTFTGLYEDVVAIAAALDELESRTGRSIPIHVDAASGGFLAPFVTPELVWDFRLPRVRSINASGHKTGLAPLGCGWVMWRQRTDLPQELVFDVNYLGGDYPTFNLSFSRPGAQVIAQYYGFLRLGHEGFRKVATACFETAGTIAEAIGTIAGLEVVHAGDPAAGIPAVTWRLAEGAELGFNLFDLADRLRTSGWLVPAYTLPPELAGQTVQRVLVRHGFSRDLASHLVTDIEGAVSTLERHPPSTSMTEAEAGGFSHDARPAASAVRPATGL
jgi:glutamate decarboxylase